MGSPEPKKQLKYRFGEFTLDPGRGTVLRAGRVVKLRPKVYEVLLYVLENRGRLIAKKS
jgi:DNA-binding winged helix-turn-helix (wHTH) protein